MFKKIKQFIDFIKCVTEDPRIPSRDKGVILAMLALIISPIDFIPDWIPIIGVLDDLIILALVLDYLFEVLDSEVLLFHYPFGLKSFVFMRRCSRLISGFAPRIIKDHVWKYKPDIYKN